MGRRLHVLCWHDDSNPDESRLRELEILSGQYRLGVETQMHFNELILRTRTMGMYGAVLHPRAPRQADPRTASRRGTSRTPVTGNLNN